MASAAQLRARRLFAARYGGRRPGHGRRRNPRGGYYEAPPMRIEHEYTGSSGGGGGMGTLLLVGGLGLGAYLLFSGGGSLFGGGTSPGGFPILSTPPAGTIVGTLGTPPPAGYRQVAVTSGGLPIYAPASVASTILGNSGIQKAGAGIITAVGGLFTRLFGGGAPDTSPTPGSGGISTADILRPVEIPTQDLGTVGAPGTSLADVNRPIDVSTWMDPATGEVGLGPVAPDPNMVPVDLTGATWFDPTTGQLVVAMDAPGGNFVPWDLPPGGYDVVMADVLTDAPDTGGWFDWLG